MSMDMKEVLVTFKAPVSLLEKFDRVVTARYTNRSAFLRELMAREVDALFGADTPQETTEE